PLTAVRYLKDTISPVWIEVFKDSVLIGHIKNYDAIVFLIDDKDIAKSYVDYFRLLWKTAQK
ncbi:hypothetical protein ACFL0V_07155, partial [Nanoarchaeota archaeon]